MFNSYSDNRDAYCLMLYMLDVVYVTGVACSFKKMLLLFAVFVMSGGLSALMFSQNSKKNFRLH